MSNRVVKEANKVYLKDFPFFPQRDNRINPGGACNVTSVAMCLNWLGIRGNGNGQLEDQMYQRCSDNSWSRHEPWGLIKLIESYNKDAGYTDKGSLKLIREAIDDGKPCIVHSFLTDFGHIFVISGYDDKGFIVQDPWGEWDATGYIKKSGANLHYSNALIASSCDSWSHAEFKKRYAKRDINANSIYLYRLS